MNIADRLAEIMNKNKISQYRLHQLSGVSQSSISTILSKKKRPRIDTLRALLESMNVSESEFFNGSTLEKPIQNLKIPERLKELREKRNLSQNKLAKLSHLSQGFVRSIELGEKNPTVDSVSKLCDGLGITIQEFFDGDVPPELANPPSNKKTKDLDEFLRESDIMFKGTPLSDYAKDRLRNILVENDGMSKEMNRRKKP